MTIPHHPPSDALRDKARRLAGQLLPCLDLQERIVSVAKRDGLHLCLAECERDATSLKEAIKFLQRL